MLGPCQRILKVVEGEGDCDTNCNWCTWNSLKRRERKNGGNGNQMKNQDHPDYVEISQNT